MRRNSPEEKGLIWSRENTLRAHANRFRELQTVRHALHEDNKNKTTHDAGSNINSNNLESLIQCDKNLSIALYRTLTYKQ